ncbi:MAG: nucleoside triphosphate pyrophosphohydrolase [Anaerovibrio sp.]|uniref:nucleoside triphosphate pyrophosphohydrolase n=1 Tax=Anaerovibrio sp. TaxID=1872532 RepID=UPI0025DB2C2B|nr:nucleoside triphosphate pyrophosphohydrolase [Anaerovibrio sp.]MCR5176605.1 nucleoside triphosphate pyrophosphohydrolase [Anaerovibrio sp.]
MGSITVTGLGPGAFGLITLDSWERMQNAGTLLLRTAKHPTVPFIREKGVVFESYDSFYDGADSFDELYKAIVADLVRRAEGEDIVYAVPGSPMVAEKTVVLLRKSCMENGIKLEIIPGMSFVELLYSKLGLDPIDGMTIIDAEDFDKLPIDMPTGLVITQVYNERIASDTKLSLMEVFPDEYPVTYVHKLGMPDESIREIKLFELDRQPDIDYLTSIYISPFLRKKEFDITPLKDIIHQLRSPGGCPWDIAQTHESIRINLLEETYEVLEAIDIGDNTLLCEELGDLLLQVVFHARMAEETGAFSMQDVVDGATEKLIRRHPHIFGDVQAADAGEAILTWEAIKKQEKKERKSVLDGVPSGIPALMGAQKLQHKAAKVGFDWEKIDDVWTKFKEEIDELKEAQREGDAGHIQEELGDVLFTAVNLARFLQVDSELALLECNRKFKARFGFVEEQVKSAGKDWTEWSLEELDNFWNKAKKL